jgi:hypothetical protein
MNPTTQPAAWLTEEETNANIAGLGEAFELLELLARRLRGIVHEEENRRAAGPPTFEDLGRLWSFVDGLDGELNHAHRCRESLRTTLDAMEALRLDAIEPMRKGEHQ